MQKGSLKSPSAVQLSFDVHKKAESFTWTISSAKRLFILGAASEFALWKDKKIIYFLPFDKAARRLSYVTYLSLAASFIVFVIITVRGSAEQVMWV